MENLILPEEQKKAMYIDLKNIVRNLSAAHTRGGGKSFLSKLTHAATLADLGDQMRDIIEKITVLGDPVAFVITKTEEYGKEWLSENQSAEAL